MGQDGPRWGQQKAETEQILDVRETGQSRVADFGGLNQVRLNGPWPPPRVIAICAMWSLRWRGGRKAPAVGCTSRCSGGMMRRGSSFMRDRQQPTECLIPGIV